MIPIAGGRILRLSLCTQFSQRLLSSCRHTARSQLPRALSSGREAPTVALRLCTAPAGARGRGLAVKMIEQTELYAEAELQALRHEVSF